MTADLTHVAIASDGTATPRMVDVGGKPYTQRTAVAVAQVRFPKPIALQLQRDGYQSAKGAIKHTAVIAGVMAAKQTHALIPFCHPLALTRCDVEITHNESGNLLIECTCAVFGPTGVEMEALTGASVAALTIYDMTKALSHEIEIHSVRLLRKSGGKRTVG